MYHGRDLQELLSTPLTHWNLEELSFYHYVMSNMVSYMNEQGVSFHQDLIGEIVNRGGIQTSSKSNDTSHVEDSGELLM